VAGSIVAEAVHMRALMRIRIVAVR